MRFICSGTTGVHKRGAVEEFKKYSDESGDELTIQIISLEEHLKERGGFDDITLFLNSYNWQAQKNAWERAFHHILEEISRSEADVILLCMHLVYYRNSRFLSPLNINLVDEFNPDGFITLIDDIYLLKKRIQERSETSPFKTSLRLRDLISWRSIETNLADILSAHLSKGKTVQNYILSVKHPIKTMCDIIKHPEKLKTYIAHPITSTRNDPRLISEIEDFKARLHELFITFDPTTIDERLLSISLQKQFPEWQTMKKGELSESIVNVELDDRWPISHDSLLCGDVTDLFPIQIPADEIDEVTRDIDNQIQNRDYRLISQSDAIIAYRPNLNEKLSTGVFSEMQYARDVAFIPCYMYFPAEDGDEESTPFKGRGSSFRNIDTLLQTLKRHKDDS